MKFNFDIPRDEQLEEAKRWWAKLPNFVKAKCSIWVILAMYAEHVLRTRTVKFDRDEKTSEV